MLSASDRELFAGFPAEEVEQVAAILATPPPPVPDVVHDLVLRTAAALGPAQTSLHAAIAHFWSCVPHPVSVPPPATVTAIQEALQGLEDAQEGLFVEIDRSTSSNQTHEPNSSNEACDPPPTNREQPPFHLQRRLLFLTHATARASVHALESHLPLPCDSPPMPVPRPGCRNVLITSALPYVNSVPHLGNLIGSTLSADMYARFCRQRRYNTLFVCGTDEYGTATETRALEEGVSCEAICDRYYAQHLAVYEHMRIQFDYFGRTATAAQTEIAQAIFCDIRAHGFLFEESAEQPYCPRDGRFLADRLVEGTCPHCTGVGARGDQCDRCGKLLTPAELVEPRCKLCGAPPVPRATTHLMLDLRRLQPELEAFVAAASSRWTPHAVATTQAWLKEGLRPRAITRDLRWGTPVPHAGYEDKVFYVWFDAPIGYISITSDAFGADGAANWPRWWMADGPHPVELVQFMGKDNVPFHTLVFPASLLATRRPWNLLHALSSTEYLTYGREKFSKSNRVGIFGDEICADPLPADYYRYYLATIRPETADADFTREAFQRRVNADLADNMGNLALRVLGLIAAKCGGHVPAPALGDLSAAAFVLRLRAAYRRYLAYFERLGLKEAVQALAAIGALSNEHLQKTRPWAVDADGARTAIYWAAAALKLLALGLHPFAPGLALQLLAQLGERVADDPDPTVVFRYRGDGRPRHVDPVRAHYARAALALPADFSFGLLAPGQAIARDPRPIATKIGLHATQLDGPASIFGADLRVAILRQCHHDDPHLDLHLDLGTFGVAKARIRGASPDPRRVLGQSLVVLVNFAGGRRGSSDPADSVRTVLPLVAIKDARRAFIQPLGEAQPGERFAPGNGCDAASDQPSPITAKQLRALRLRVDPASGKIVYQNRDLIGREGARGLGILEEGNWNGALIG